MPPRTGWGEPELARSFAGVYDALYDDAEFLAARTAFVRDVVGPLGRLPLLDAGCGTASQTRSLMEAGYAAIGLDFDPLMLAAARRKYPVLRLVRGDVRRLPFERAFSAILCLESPLAYLLGEDELALALRGCRRALVPQGRLVIDTFDYPATLGAGRVRARRNQFARDQMTVDVTESHHFDASEGIWTMRQRFAVSEGDARWDFDVQHRLKMRSAGQMAAALEAAGFEPRAMLASYPNLPERFRAERRLIVVAVSR